MLLMYCIFNHVLHVLYAGYKGAVLAQWAHVGLIEHYDKLVRMGLASSGRLHREAPDGLVMITYVDDPLVT